jgi:hypothetical protein
VFRANKRNVWPDYKGVTRPRCSGVNYGPEEASGTWCGLSLALGLLVRYRPLEHELGVGDPRGGRDLRQVGIVLEEPLRVEGLEDRVTLALEMASQAAPVLLVDGLVRAADGVPGDRILAHNGVPILLLAAAAALPADGLGDLAEHVLRLLLVLDHRAHDALDDADLEVLLQSALHHAALLPRHWKRFLEFTKVSLFLSLSLSLSISTVSAASLSVSNMSSRSTESTSS